MNARTVSFRLLYSALNEKRSFNTPVEAMKKLRF